MDSYNTQIPLVSIFISYVYDQLFLVPQYYPYLAFNPFIYINTILEIIPLQNIPLFLENLDM